MVKETKIDNVAMFLYCQDSFKKKIQRSLTNTNIITSIIILTLLIIIYYIINYYFEYLNQIIYLIIAPLLTVLYIKLNESHSSQEKEQELMFAFTNELTRNYRNMLVNYQNIVDEIALTNENRIKYAVLQEVQLDMYSLLKQIYPQRLINIGHYELESYVNISNLINGLIKTRDHAGLNRHLSAENYLSVIENLDGIIVKNINELLTKILEIILKLNVRIVVLNPESILSLTDEEKLTFWLKKQGLSRNATSTKAFERIYKMNAKLNIIILDR